MRGSSCPEIAPVLKALSKLRGLQLKLDVAVWFQNSFTLWLREESGPTVRLVWQGPARGAGDVSFDADALCHTYHLHNMIHLEQIYPRSRKNTHKTASV